MVSLKLKIGCFLSLVFNSSTWDFSHRSSLLSRLSSVFQSQAGHTKRHVDIHCTSICRIPQKWICHLLHWPKGSQGFHVTSDIATRVVKVSIFRQARQFSTPGTPGLAGAVTPFPRPQPPEEADLELLLLLLWGITHPLLYSNSEQEYCIF